MAIEATITWHMKAIFRIQFVSIVFLDNQLSLHFLQLMTTLSKLSLNNNSRLCLDVCCVWFRRPFYSPISFINLDWLQWQSNLLARITLVITYVRGHNSTSSAQSSLGQGVPRGSVLGPLLIIIYPLCSFSSLISDAYVGYMYADDNQLFIYIVASQFSAINFTPACHCWSCLSMDVFQSFVTLSVQDGVSPHWSSCSISQNSRHSLLMPSKTPPITPNSSSRNLGIIFVRSTLSMYYFICSVSKSCFISIRDLRRIRNTRSWLHHRTHYHHISRTLKTR